MFTAKSKIVNLTQPNFMRVMDLHPIYPKICYYLGFGHTQKTKEYFQEIEDMNKIK